VSNLISSGHPSALGDESSGLLVDLGLSNSNLVLKQMLDKQSQIVRG
jgi:hypothetical protein